MRDRLLWMVEYWSGVYRLTKAQLFMLFTRVIFYFSGKDED